jgi:murein DD-endopeptidase MepM/ murein hydrolase activator NlpD
VAGVLAPVQPAAQPAVAAAPPARSAPAVAVGRGGLAQFERVLASAGVDVPHLFAQYGMRTGEGGPFIPAPRGAAVPDSSLTPEKLAALSRIVKALPVTAPLQNYEIGSNFGVRGDPINGRASYHTGLDFRAPYMSPVYSTAPGVVTFAGYRADYGKIVEIDHGHGITTRYGHLHRYTVSVGQRVAGHSHIGFLGSTGRATGPHVHYEVLVNGEPQDPTKFLGLGRLVPVTQL